MKAMLLQKHSDYGSSFAEPLCVFSKLPAEEALRVRLDDKLKRLKTGRLEIAEDTTQDIIGYLVLLRVLRRMGGAPRPEFPEGQDIVLAPPFPENDTRTGR